MATITVVPSESADPRAWIDACRIEVTEADFARTPDNTGGPFEQFIEAIGPSEQRLKSHVFVPSHDGEHSWFPVVFDEPGSWTINLVDNDDDTVIETLAQEVQ